MRIRLLILTIVLILLSILCFFEYGVLNSEASESTQVVDEVRTVKQIKYLPIDEYERHLLARIAMAEAESEGLKGKALVMNVILNRVKSKDFPNSIEEVIFQEYQFTPVSDGRFYEVTPNKECWDAFELVRTGYDESQGALYFISDFSENTWHSRNLEALFVHNNHKFYK